ncbi:ABC transporter ATP-binding protein [Spirochaetia bacterium 38H-sp]|uniref:ABC transporter ATP-binding protein n=1 Tax=Rarispira pelagica TaxID=3141764 RepID=A0ABU9UE90_9SPIR
MSSCVVSGRGVVKDYPMGGISVRALDGVDFDIHAGEFVSIMGPSGSGKSTLMHIIGCLDVPTSGLIEIDGIDVSGYSETELAKIRNKKIGFVFQQFFLLPRLNLIENVEVPLLYAGIDYQKRRQKAVEMLNAVGLGDRLYHKPGELSGGQRQRAAIARALVNDPEIILADEPTGALDSVTGEKILELFKGINKKGKTIIVVTHDNEVASYADRTIRLRDGKIVESAL